jgi:GNAT superfamily N-acetyltransferase
VRAEGGAADALPDSAIDITQEPFDSPVARALVSALISDLDERYGEDPADGDDPEVAAQFTVRAEQVTPPAGAFLVARLESEAAALGYGRLQLETGLRQPEAIALYESAGYHRIPSYGQYEGDELSVCFAKDIGSSAADGRGHHRASVGPGGPERTYHSHP